MHRLTRVLLSVAFVVALCGLAPRTSAARPQQEAYAAGVGADLGLRHESLAYRPRGKRSGAGARGRQTRRAEVRHGRGTRRLRHGTRHQAARAKRGRANRTRRRATARGGFDPAEMRSPGSPSFSFAPDPILHGADSRLASDGSGAGGQAGTPFSGPPNSTNIQNLGTGHGQMIVVPLFKLLNELSGQPPPSQ
jgi:hypothetical protein